MVRKGRIILANGHWTAIDGGISGSSVPLKPYWGSPFEREAERFFGLAKDVNTHLYLDGSTVVGFDESGGERYDRGANDYDGTTGTSRQSSNCMINTTTTPRKPARYATPNTATPAIKKPSTA